MNPDPFATNAHPMSYQDAVTVALILTAATLCAVFMPTHGYDVLVREPGRFAFDLVIFAFGEFITLFVSLTGLTIYAKNKESG